MRGRHALCRPRLGPAAGSSPWPSRAVSPGGGGCSGECEEDSGIEKEMWLCAVVAVRVAALAGVTWEGLSEEVA